MANTRVGWVFDRPVAELQCGGLRGRVDVGRPELGVHQLRLDGRGVDGELLALSAVGNRGSQEPRDREWPVEIADAYVRENDLVAAYRPADRWPFAPQVYWRGPSNVAPVPAPCALSLLVSVQTDLLDTNPEIRVTTCLPAVEVTELHHAGEGDAQAMLWRLADRDWSYLEFMPRSDYGAVSIGGDGAGNMTCEWGLFGEFLEKGVIWRARVSAAFLPRAGDEETAAECCRIFAARPLPLTT